MADEIDAEWPGYDIGPRECMFALGVVAVKYAQLEFALSGMFSTVTGVGRDATARLLQRIRNNVRLDRMRESLPSHRWPKEVNERVEHFIADFNACARNRNLLMHSNIFMMTKDAIILYKDDNSGKTVSCNPTLAEIRQVADDMNALFDYGLALSNAINMNLVAKPRTWLFPWPDEPPPPCLLNYTGEPAIVRDMRSQE